jgi:glucosylceramidase
MANFDTVLLSPEAMKYIAGVGLQWEGKNIIHELHKKYPTVKLIQTESECGNGDFAWKDAEHLFYLMKKYLDGGVTAYTYWNMVLADKGTSSWGWNQNALIQIDKASRKIAYTPEYYAFKHFSYFIPAGSLKVESTGSFKELVAFLNANGELVMVANNLQDMAKALKIKIGDKYFMVTLQPKSFNTFSVKI